MDRGVAMRVIHALERFTAEGKGDVTRLQGGNELRLRVGDWRVRFQLDYEAQVLEVLRVLPRGRAYRS